MPLETARPRRKHRRWWDGVEPATPVSRITVRTTTSNLSLRVSEVQVPSVQPNHPVKLSEEGSPYFWQSVSSLEGEKPPGWMLPFLGLAAVMVVIMALAACYHW